MSTPWLPFAIAAAPKAVELAGNAIRPVAGIVSSGFADLLESGKVESSGSPQAVSRAESVLSDSDPSQWREQLDNVIEELTGTAEDAGIDLASFDILISRDGEIEIEGDDPGATEWLQKWFAENPELKDQLRNIQRSRSLDQRSFLGNDRELPLRFSLGT